MKKHELKISPEYFDSVDNMRKPFEVRKNDRSFLLGDMVVLQEWSPDFGYTGRETSPRFIEYILDSSPGLHPDYVVLLLRPYFSFTLLLAVVSVFGVLAVAICSLWKFFF